MDDNPNALGIGKTTLYEDLKDIEYRIFSGEIERIKDGRTTYLRYADPNYSISNHPLSETEALQLKSAITVLCRFKGSPQFEWVNKIIPIIESKLGLVTKEKEVLEFEENLYYSGSIHIAPLFNSIVNQRVLKINYQDFKSPAAYEIEFHPYYLKQHNSRWFVLGCNSNRPNQTQTLALDRIKSIQEIDLKYKIANIDWNEYFSDVVGVTRFDAPLVEIKLLILNAEQASYIQTKPIHQSQKPIRKVEGGYETSIKVIPNPELEKLLLSFGEKIKVLSPASLKRKILSRVEKMYLSYCQ
jgi:predicted DNA-binding transcriptional regulator YafY